MSEFDYFLRIEIEKEKCVGLMHLIQSIWPDTARIQSIIERAADAYAEEKKAEYVKSLLDQ